jgi:hypothetical protein
MTMSAMRRCESSDSVTLLAGAAFHRLLEVEAGAEILAGAAQQYDARVAVALQALKIAVERVDQRGIERIQALRTIERHPVEAILVFDEKRLSHHFLS